MTSTKDSSFLDPRLQQNLAKSLRIQSKLRTPSSSNDSVGDARKSIFTQGINLRSNRNSSIVGNTSDATLLRVIKKLIETESISVNISSMMSPEDVEKLTLIRNTQVRSKKSQSEDDKSRIAGQRKARNLFKEDLLYSTGKKVEPTDEIDDILDYDKVIHEIEELKSEKSKLIVDINKCEQFIQLKSSSSFFRFKYLLTKLHYIRKYKRKELIETVQAEIENIEKSMTQINTLRSTFDREIASFHQAIKITEADNLAMIKQHNDKEQKLLSTQFLSEHKLDLLDEKLAAIIKAFKDKTNRYHIKKIKDKSKLEIDSICDETITVENVMKDSAVNFNEFKENVASVMQRCFRMTEGRLQRLAATRKALLEDKTVPQSERIVATVTEVERNISTRQESLSRMVELEENLRLSAEKSFEDRARSLISAVAQSEQSSVNLLKTHYHNIYAKSPSRTRRRSTVLL